MRKKQGPDPVGVERRKPRRGPSGGVTAPISSKPSGGVTAPISSKPSGGVTAPILTKRRGPRRGLPGVVTGPILITPKRIAHLGKGEQAKKRIISVAEALFTKHGFDGASMRDIAAAAKMQPASMYYYFPSKDELLWAVWQKGGDELRKRVSDAVALETGPWQRMEAACVAHVTGMLDWKRAIQVLFVMPPWHYPDSIKDRVISLREAYEQIFVKLIDDLPLRSGTDRRYLRLTIIGALSWSLFWYKKDRDSPAAIAERILAMLRAGVEKKPTSK